MVIDWDVPVVTGDGLAAGCGVEELFPMSNCSTGFALRYLFIAVIVFLRL